MECTPGVIPATGPANVRTALLALVSRSEIIEKAGIMGMDAIHIACAQRAGAIFLTCDDALIKIMKKHSPDYPYRSIIPCIG